MRGRIGWLWIIAGCWSTTQAPPPPPPLYTMAAEPPPPAPPPTGFAQPPAPTTPPPIDAGAPVAASPPSTAPWTIPACGTDEVWEALCGGMGTGTGTCGATADTNASWGYQRLVLTMITRGKADPALKQFVYDDAETRTYAASIPPSGAGLPGPFCCHSRCTPLVVAKRAPAPNPPAGHHLSSFCIPPPASTRAPAKQNPSCPAAVELANVLAPYNASNQPPHRSGREWWHRANGRNACCYTIVERDPEPVHGGHCPTCKCAAAGTLIATPDGEVAIESLAPGNLVLSMDRGALRAVPLTAVHRERVHDHVLVAATLANGRSVAMSPQHPTADGHHFADLAEGSLLGDVRVVAVQRVPYAGEYTYDLLPASDSATYVASGALVGSTLKP